MSAFAGSSLYFGMLLSVGAYLFGMWLRKKTGLSLCNPLLVAIVAVILFLSVFRIEYGAYSRGADYLSYLLTPATVCLAIPLYRQLELLRRQAAAVAAAILTGVAGSAASIYVMSLLFKLEHVYYVTLLPKSITTAIAIGVTEELNGISAVTVAAVIITGIIGAVTAGTVFKLFRINEPVAQGLACGTASHAIGTTKALEMGEIQGAMSSLAIVASGLVTVFAAPAVASWI